MANAHDHTTRDAILTYLSVDDQPVTLGAICAYMRLVYKTDRGTVRACVHRLLKAGRVRHPATGFYQRGRDDAEGVDRRD